MYISEIILSVYTNKFNMQLLFMYVCVCMCYSDSSLWNRRTLHRWFSFGWQLTASEASSLTPSMSLTLRGILRMPLPYMKGVILMTRYIATTDYPHSCDTTRYGSFQCSNIYGWMQACKQPCTCMSCILSLIVIMHGITLCMHTLKDAWPYHVTTMDTLYTHVYNYS